MRPAQLDDLDIILKLARTVHFINLPADKDIIAEKITRSRESFQDAASNTIKSIGRPEDESATAGSPIFMFVIADPATDSCIGTCMVVAKMGTPGHPNVSYELERREFFSEDLQSGATHTVAKLFLDTSGKSEIGGLIIGPSMRKHPQRLGKQLSLIRFHYMGSHREQFSDQILAEMMAPISADGRNVFWENFGRRFINLSYVEADKFCQYSREFMTSLLPHEDMYLTLLPPEARQGIAQVGKDTVPARKMLEALGFEYHDRIDPFDGGPHLEVKTDDVSLVRYTERGAFAGTCKQSEAKLVGFVSVESEGGSFRAVHSAYTKDDDGSIRVPKDSMHILKADAGMRAAVTPLDLNKSMRPNTLETNATESPQGKSKSSTTGATTS